MHKVALSFNDGRTQFIGVNPNEVLIDAALRHGLTLPVDCREGVCASCKGTCQSGRYDLDYVDEDALSEEDLARGGILACQMRVQSDCTVRFDFDSSLCNSAGPELVDARVTRVEVLSDSTATLHLDAGARAGQLDFLPGQYAHVQVPGTDEWRSYSFACEPNADNQLQLLIRLLPDGVMSNYLRERAQPGDHIQLKAPLGAFYLQQVTRPLIFVAGGTGLAAFLGMLDQMASNPKQMSQPVRLFYGVTKPQDLCELERLKGYEQSVPGFSFHSIVMNPDASWQGATGVVTDLFEESHFNGGEVDAYLCGPPPMVEAVKSWLDARQMENSRIYFEKFSAS
ncbi:anthranilate 1,2-dioxygenase electron transfer component AntC [Marinobacterium sp. D7]|uniref:anthranilate 1,2-dioxygenase electron transfer component AntC n=1 Tax=Marinobacterium ramblicola TaxID=2849041 RepID=UPI001C2DF0FB|nr:anthranilate 1,2-dioxygenase electron transfer component AntC [Marinobacterium ramblicola]MBV1789112.1 anthranilate 1,2-dioxygenase electron transfer component AntC [Marinobacterium ramblicola]